MLETPLPPLFLVEGLVPVSHHTPLSGISSGVTAVYEVYEVYGVYEVIEMLLR